VSLFLRPLLETSAESCRLVSERTGSVLAAVLEAALDSRSRRRGLLGRSGLAECHALILAPCSAVHTFFMRFPIDVIFVARDGRVLKIVEQVGAWRVTASFGAFAVIELAGGALRGAGLASGERIVIRPGVPAKN
jgi:uncharacterized protein